MSVLERERILGVQEPRISWVPPYVSSAGEEALELCELAGLHLDPWQRYQLVHALGERADGSWAAFEVGSNEPRQNGKGGIIEGRELAGVFLFGELLQIHSAHEFATSMEAFLRMEAILDGAPDLSRYVTGVSRSHGSEGFTFRIGQRTQRLRYRTRTKGGGRGFTGDLLILDEAMILPSATIGALLPTLSARPNPQVWYLGSAVDQLVHEHGVVFARIRERGLRGGDPRLAYFEHSAEALDARGRPLTPDKVDRALLEDRVAWAQANPALGIRISAEHVEAELEAMGPREFAVERLGIGDWPATDSATGSVIALAVWDDLRDARSRALDPVAFAFDVTPDRAYSAIGAAGRRADGRVHLETIDWRPGTDWVVPRLAALAANWRSPLPVRFSSASPAASLTADLERAGVAFEAVQAGEEAQACGLLYDFAVQDRVRHRGQPELRAALKAARKRPLGDAWAWSRKGSQGDITQLVSVTLALWGLHTAPPPAPERSWRPL